MARSRSFSRKFLKTGPAGRLFIHGSAARRPTFGVCWIPFLRTRFSYLIISIGNLLHLAQENLAQPLMKRILKSALKGLATLHEKGVIHNGKSTPRRESLNCATNAS